MVFAKFVKFLGTISSNIFFNPQYFFSPSRTLITQILDLLLLLTVTEALLTVFSACFLSIVSIG